MTKKDLLEARRRLLDAEIKRIGLTELARRAKKPVRQISDMAAGRKTFGDGVAIEIGPKIRPDLPREWLVYCDADAGCIEDEILHVSEPKITSSPTRAPIEANFLGRRARKVNEVLEVLGNISDDGLIVVLHELKKFAIEYPIDVPKTDR